MKTNSNLLLASIALLSINSFAGPEPLDCDIVSEDEKQVKKMVLLASNNVEKVCPDPSKLHAICNDIYQKHEDRTPNTPYQFQYERKIYQAACADIENDSEEEAARKIRDMWNKLAPKLTCQDANFNVINGSILKYAVKMNTYDLLDRAVEFWKVNLNSIDSSDQKTLLDYIQSEIEKNKGGTQEQRLKDYYRILKKHGAKHSSEL